MRRMRGVSAVVVAVLAGGGLAFGTPLEWVTAADSASGCQRSVGDEEHAQRLREAVGLPHSAVLVAASFSLPGYSCEVAGIPLSADEEAAFLGILDAQAELSNLTATVAADPTFAGAWLDAGTLTIASIDGELGGNLRTARGSIKVRAAQFTKTDLDAVATEIAYRGVDGLIGPLADAITYVSVDERANRVSVGVMANVQDAASAFGRVYGDIVSVVYAEPRKGEYLICTKDDCGTKGGLSLNHDLPGGQIYGCTSGFVGKAKPVGDSSYNHRILTAGHCISDTGGPSNTQNWYNPALTQTWGPNKAMDFYRYFGYNAQRCPYNDTVCVLNDLGFFGVGNDPPAYWNRYFKGGSPAWVEIDGRTAKSNQLVGQVVFVHGRTSGYVGGPIVAKQPVYTRDCGVDLKCRDYNVVQVDVTAALGDSGAGFFRIQSDGYGGYDNNAYGFLSFGLTVTPFDTFYHAWDELFYADYDRTDQRIIYPCITADCPLS